MIGESAGPGIRTVVCNEDIWYLRAGARLGLYVRDLTHSTVETSILAVPRREVDYWRRRLAELRAGTLEDGPAKAMLLHEEVHSRQMSGRPFWLWALRYFLSKRFRRRMEEEAYTVHLVYLARCGVRLNAPYWRDLLVRLYFGAFDERRAAEAFERIAATARRQVPGAEVTEEPQDAALYEPCHKATGQSGDGGGTAGDSPGDSGHVTQ